ncbi:ABC transporter ATP-binding protein [Pseudoruegeria sp. SK021]|uniref:ABC transporter ATP-binding protein n=1 Tax=Pseudoruegeria sp. SK021 TaxID=1933035 RepID=UPI000A22B728|nr:ABC transporter ATP-binding protein [Pseudoruegeria sp. SK021]OSP56469.1 ABC transporter ATP-binding protein [Pseudoruegeria sp. SK021]
MTVGPGIQLQGSAQLGADLLFPTTTLDLVPGGWTCLLGPSGIGKSTLLRLIAGLPTGATFNGTLRASDDAALDGRVAYMAQDDLLLPWLSVRENVCVGARLRGTRPDLGQADALIARVGLSDQASRRPATLSGGQRQRVALARTLMEDRPIVLLDEPFSALDARTRADMQELAAETLHGRTVLLVTHDPWEAARLSHRIYLMRRTGLETMPAPPGTPVRAVEDPATLRYQAELLGLLRSEP